MNRRIWILAVMGTILFCLFGGMAVSGATDAQASPVSPSDSVTLEKATDIASQVHYLAFSGVYAKAQQVRLRQTDSTDGYYYAEALDGDELTFRHSYGTTLTLESKTAFSRVYIKLESSAHWKLRLPDGTVRNSSLYGYLHELADLGQSVKKVELILPRHTKLTDVTAYTDGRLPDDVQVWQPPCEKADLLVMPAHADDEHLWFGGALPYYAGELGYQVQVAYLTNHSGDTKRCHEQLNGLWKVGVRHYPVITNRFPDVMGPGTTWKQAARRYGKQNVLDFEVEMLRRFRPDVVIAHDVNGEYGNGAHSLYARLLPEAAEAAGDASRFPVTASQFGVWHVSKCYLHLYDKNRIVVRWSKMPLKRFGGKSALQVARSGFACHVSQQGWLKVREEGAYDCRKFGLAYTAVGKDTPGRNDMFEHVARPKTDKPQKEESGEPVAPQLLAPQAVVPWVGTPSVTAGMAAIVTD